MPSKKEAETKRRGYGEGYVSRMPDGTFRGQLSAGTDPLTGKRRRMSVYGENKKEVTDKLVSLRSELQKGELVMPTHMTLQEWLSTWLAEYMKPHLRATTWDSYETMIRCHVVPHLGTMRLQDLRSERLQSYYNWLLAEGRSDGKGGLSSKTVRYIHGILRGSMSQAVKNRLIPFDPTSATKPPRKQKKEIQPLSAEQVLRFLETAKSDRLYAAFRLEFMTGLRLGEVLALTWDDVDMVHHLLRVRRTLLRVREYGEGGRKTRLTYQEPKTAKARRTLPLPLEVTAVLETHRATQDNERQVFGEAYNDHRLVFCCEDGNAIDPRNFTRRWERLLKTAGLPHVRFHDAAVIIGLNQNPTRRAAI